MSEHAGNIWYKCDLHLHTMVSRCYIDKDNTPEEWVAEAKRKGLDAVAVTDHNDYRGIDAVMEEGKKQGLAVFPGVEITCDTSKIHMLILFDTVKRAENVRDFLNRCDIDSDHIGDPDGTSLGVFEVCEIAKKRGAMVIAAHIDEFNSVSSMNPANLEKLFTGGYIDAVQVANFPVWKKLEKDGNVQAMQETLQKRYGADATPRETERWRKCFCLAERLQLPMLAFSDNPATPEESRHGLDGIGSVYTWIQMDDDIDLESIRQSLYTADSRIRMMYDSADRPKIEPDFWIRSVEVRNTTLNPHVPVRYDFHPQLNCIIGGKNSGKSALVYVMLGVCRQLSEDLLNNTFAQHSRFYSRENGEGAGIFREDSEIEVCFSMYGTDYRLLVDQIKGIGDQRETFFMTNPESGEEQPLLNGDILRETFSSIPVFTQRQIQEIAAAGTILELLDSAIDGIYLEKARKEFYIEQLVNLYAGEQAAYRFLNTEKSARSEYSLLQTLNQPEKTPEALQDYVSTSCARREEALHWFDDCREEIQRIQQLAEKLHLEYEACLERIRARRRNFIESALSEDENYRVELAPMSSRASLRKKLRETLCGEDSLMTEDIKKLENAIFSPKNGVKKYSRLLAAARSGSELSESESFSPYFIHLVRKLSEQEFSRLLLFRPEDELLLYYHPNGVKRFFPMTTASTGERSAAILSFILSGSNVPLVIDQPEDGMDSSVIYKETIPKLKKAKQTRQLIIVTQNANIALNADPEMILCMDSRSKFVRVKMKGSVDKDEIRREVCDVMEGTEEGFMRRVRKYHLYR